MGIAMIKLGSTDIVFPFTSIAIACYGLCLIVLWTWWLVLLIGSVFQ